MILLCKCNRMINRICHKHTPQQIRCHFLILLLTLYQLTGNSNDSGLLQCRFIPRIFFLRLHWSAEEMLHVRNGSASEMQSFSLPLLHLPSQYSECFHPERSQSQSHISYPPASDLTQPRVIPDYVLSVPSLCGYCFRIRHSAPQYF